MWLYDERGSRLFDRITQLPEYYLTRSEAEILASCASTIAERTAATTLVELGSGTSEKTRLLLDALEEEGTLECFVPLDVSEEVLRTSARAIADRYRTIGVHAIVGDFERHLRSAPAGEARLIAFLGSTIGNLTPERRARLLQSVASLLGKDDAFLLGVDLVKDRRVLEAAYNDPGGVTEAFVRNGLDVVNRELDATFDHERLGFEAVWDERHEWMEIGFRAVDGHHVDVRGLDVSLPLAAGEWLRFEISAKFRRVGLERELAAAGLVLDAWWTDSQAAFGITLVSRSPRGL